MATVFSLGVPGRIRTSDTRFRRAGQNAVATRLRGACATVSATLHLSSQFEIMLSLCINIHIFKIVTGDKMNKIKRDSHFTERISFTYRMLFLRCHSLLDSLINITINTFTCSGSQFLNNSLLTLRNSDTDTLELLL